MRELRALPEADDGTSIVKIDEIIVTHGRRVREK